MFLCQRYENYELLNIPYYLYQLQLNTSNILDYYYCVTYKYKHNLE